MHLWQSIYGLQAVVNIHIQFKLLINNPKKWSVEVFFLEGQTFLEFHIFCLDTYEYGWHFSFAHSFRKCSFSYRELNMTINICFYRKKAASTLEKWLKNSLNSKEMVRLRILGSWEKVKPIMSTKNSGIIIKCNI